ncbi:MAG: hypothetical protein JJU13_16995 [Balneolaceae bacterium]|nr:hypothetical protein [Balneolaceae bacterium]
MNHRLKFRKSSDEFFKKYTNVDDWDDPGTTRLMTLSHFTVDTILDAYFCEMNPTTIFPLF